MVFAFLRSKKPGTSYLKPAFSRQLVAVGAYRKRPAGGCAGAGTHFYRAAGRDRSSIGLAPSPCPASLPGRRHGCPGPVLAGFTRMLNQAGMCCRKQGNGPLRKRARRDRPSKKPTPLPQRRRPHANQIKGRSRLVVRPAARTRVTARTPHRGRAAARRRSRCRARECIGRHAALLLSSMPSFLCTKQAEQGSKTLCVFNAMPFA